MAPEGKNKGPEDRRKLTAFVLTALFSAALAVVLDLSGLVRPLQFKLYDLFLYHRLQVHSPSAGKLSPLVLVEIDDLTIAEPGFRIPRALWHQYFSTVIKGLTDGGAIVIGLDFLLPQQFFDDMVPGYSQAWLEAFEYAEKNGARLVTGMFQTERWRVMPDEGYLAFVGPERLGLLNLTVDRDGFCRRQRLFFPDRDAPGRGLYSISFAMVKARHPNWALPGDTIYIDFDRPDKAFPRYSFAEVYNRALEGDIEYLKKDFQDRVVLIGETDSLTPHAIPTPLSYLSKSPEKSTNHLEIVAHTINTILNRGFFSEVGQPLSSVVYVVLAFLFGYLSFYVLPHRPVIMTVAGLTGWLIICFGAFMVYLILPGAGGILAILLAQAGLVLWQRHWKAERLTVEEVLESPLFIRQMAAELQKQGLLDAAWEKLRLVPFNLDLKADLVGLAHEYERKRSFKKALSVYEYLKGLDREDQEIEGYIHRVREASEETIIGLHAGPALDEASTITDVHKPPTIGRYEILRELGRGAMGTVYLGQDTKIGRQTAIKTILFKEQYDKDEEEEGRARFFHEAETAGRLSHPHIVTIYDVEEEGDLGYIAMELLDGRPLGDYTLKKTLLPVRKVIEVTATIAEALDYAHQNGVVHRDVKPDNIMLLGTGEAKITDFGVARAMATSKTKTGTKKGTPFYMSPEQIMGQKVDGRSDIFSLGIVMYELLTGRHPYQATDMTELIGKITTVEPTPVTEINPEVPKAVGQILVKAMAKDKDKRYQRAAQMAQHLRLVGQKMDNLAARKKGASEKPEA
ncbi:MAG: protein kinase [Thermodesulfobacteriota bacterium]